MDEYSSFQHSSKIKERHRARERAKEKINPANEANETRQHLRESHRQADGEMEL